MGFFTYRQTKKTKKAVSRLATQNARDAQLQLAQQAAQARQTRETALFQALPPEGKAEYRAVVAAYQAKANTWSAIKIGWGGKEVRAAKAELAAGTTAVFRKYDLIP